MHPGPWFGAQHVEWHDEIDSTNTRAAQLAQDRELPLPALIVADRQTAGRGRGSNRWWSSEGSLTFSLLIDASESQLPAAKWPLVSLCSALAIKDVLTMLAPDGVVQLKWPNDVYLSQRKICGILVETPAVRPARLILGIGLNVNNSLLDAPEDVQVRATSLIDETGKTFDREQVLGNIVGRIADELALLRQSTLQLVERWSPHCLLTGKSVWIEAHDHEIAGRCAGIDEQGALLVQTLAGSQRLFAGVVKRWEL